MKKLILIAIAFITFQMLSAQTPDRFPDGIILGNFASDPTGYKPGQLYYNSTDSIVKLYDGLVWKSLGSGGAVDNRILPVVITSATYTFLEADLLESKVFIFNVIGDITATIPTITLPSGELIVATIKTINNNNFRIIPSVGVNQIEFSPRIKDEAFSIASSADDVWMKWDNVNSEDYTP